MAISSSTPPASFSTLPWELRHKIWLSTFEPRTLSLNWHEQRVPDDQYTVYATNFSVRLGLHVAQLSATDARQHHSLSPQIIYRGQDILGDSTRIKSPPGPIALEICKESREIALAHYEMFLSGFVQPSGCSKFDAVFEASGYGSPHTWVNPKIDLIFLSTMSRDLESKFAPVDAQVFYYRAKTECSRFERVGVMLHNGEGSPLLALRRYTGLKELTVYFTHRERAAKNIALEEGETYLDEEEAASAIVDFLTVKKETHMSLKIPRDSLGYDGEWTAPIPKVQVSQAIEWYRNPKGKLELRLMPLP
jgi:hypothetical protein